MTRLLSYLIGFLIPRWIDDGSPQGWRLRLIAWAWRKDDERAAAREATEAPPSEEVPF